MSKTGIIILHYQNSEDTIDCLKSITDRVNNNKEHVFFIVDNGKTFKTSLLQKDKYQDNIIILSEIYNKGFAGGINVGISKALTFNCEYIILLNNDTIASPGLVEGLVSFVKSNQSIGAVSPKIYFAPGYEFHKKKYQKRDLGQVLWYAGGKIDWQNVYISHRGVDEVDHGQFDEGAETDFVTGCCMLIKREVIEKVGLFDEKYFLYFEDVDYSVRIKRQGYHLSYYSDVHLWHKNASSSGGAGGKTSIYYQNRNRFYFGFKYASFNTKKSLLIDSVRLFLKGGISRKAVTDYYLQHMGKANL